MFGDKKVKRDRLAKLAQILEKREAGATELARELGVSRFAILDDITALEKAGVKVCERRGKFSLLKRWFRN